MRDKECRMDDPVSQFRAEGGGHIAPRFRQTSARPWDDASKEPSLFLDRARHLRGSPCADRRPFLCRETVLRPPGRSKLHECVRKDISGRDGEAAIVAQPQANRLDPCSLAGGPHRSTGTDDRNMARPRHRHPTTTHNCPSSPCIETHDPMAYVVTTGWLRGK